MVARGHVWLLWGGGCVWLLWGACMVALGGHVWLLGGMRGCSQGGMHDCSGGACVVAPGRMHGCSLGGCAWFLLGGHVRFFPGGLCVVFSGGRGQRGGMRRIRQDMVNERAVRILLECILVSANFSENCIKMKKIGPRGGGGLISKILLCIYAAMM